MDISTFFCFFVETFFGNTHRFPDLYEKTPPMSPRRVARDVIETLDTDGNGKKLFFIFLIFHKKFILLVLLVKISFYLKLELVLSSIEKL